MQAATIARYFEKKSKKLGDDFRTEVFKYQSEITKENVRAFADKFAAARKIDLPMIVDPQGKLAAEIMADRDFGQRIGISHTPTLYVVNNKTSGTPFVEVVDRSNLFQLIDQMKREAQ